jgi:hypothetical protein
MQLKAFGTVGRQIRYNEYNRSSSYRQNLARNLLLAKNPGRADIQNRTWAPGMCAFLWQAAQSVTRFLSELSPEWLRNC